jgi:threonylcarbamoyladenosine tRNA methylthiotransferase MtaB
MHIFPFSRRPGTPAAEMPGQIDRDVKRERARLAGEAAAKMARAYASSCVGRTLNVLFERETAGLSTGHAANYMPVNVRQTGLKGGVYPIRITGKKGRELLGERAEP